jgi:hypothetical protein
VQSGPFHCERVSTALTQKTLIGLCHCVACLKADKFDIKRDKGFYQKTPYLNKTKSQSLARHFLKLFFAKKILCSLL